MEEVDVALVGDTGAGKSALCAEWRAAGGCGLRVREFAGTPRDAGAWAALARAVAGVPVLCVAASTADPAQAARVAAVWLPFAARVAAESAAPRPPTTVAVVLACQTDRAAPALRGAALQAWLDGLLARHPCVEAAAACTAAARESAAAALAVVAQARAAPLTLLADTATGTLRPAFVAALDHCFDCRCDYNGDEDDHNGEDDGDDGETLSDAQLTAGTVLAPTDDAHRQQLAALKRRAARRCADAVDARGRVTRAGFVALHRVLLEAGRADYAWQVLRAAGYNRALALVPAAVPVAADVPPAVGLRALVLAVRLAVAFVGAAAVGRALVRSIAAVRLRSSSSRTQPPRSTRHLLRLLLYDLFPF